MKLEADVMDASGTQIGDGPVSLSSASVGRLIDGSGTLRFDCPADVRSRTLLRAGRYVRIVYESEIGAITLGDGIINKVRLDNGKISCDGNDLLEELKQRITLPNYAINTTVQTAVTGLVSVMGWTVEASGAALVQTVVENFEDSLTLLRATLTVADHTGLHIRRGIADGRLLEVGPFGISNGITLFDPSSVRGGDRSSGLIESLSCEEDASKLANWILPIGGEDLTLASSTNAAKQMTTGPDGNPVYYVSDTDSIALYGLRQAYYTNPDIKAPSASPGDQIIGANLLAVAALAELDKRKTIRRTYRGKIRGLATMLQPGDAVRVIYNEPIYTPAGRLWSGGQLDEQLYIVRTDRYAGDGGFWQTVELSNINALRDDETRLVAIAIERSQKKA